MSNTTMSMPAPVVNDNDAMITDHPVEASGDEKNDLVPEETEHKEADSAPSEEGLQAAKRLVEALLFASAEPLTERMLANRVPDGVNIKSLLKDLQADYAERGVNLNRAGTSWAFRTAEDLGAVLNVETEVARKMNRAGIETMAVIAYHQPVTRAEIEEIRGVSLSKGTLDMLFEKKWIKPRGRRETPGRPMTWGTTDIFLDHFGLSGLTDLPGLDELKVAGLLESGPALNVYRSRVGEETAVDGDNDQTALFPTGQDDEALSETDDAPEHDEPLDPDQ